MELNKEQNEVVKFKKSKIVIMCLVVLVAIVGGGMIFYNDYFVSTPQKTIRNFYNALQNNEIQAAMSDTDINNQVNAILNNSKSKKAFIDRMNKELNINDRTITFDILSLEPISEDSMSAIYKIEYKINIKYTNGSTYTNDTSDRISLEKIKGKWKIVNSEGMYAALQQMVNNVLSGDD